jgi:hypothetical protein
VRLRARKTKPKSEKPMEFYTTDACCQTCKERHGFFAPAICCHNNGSGRDVWYDRETCRWTIDSPVAAPSDDGSASQALLRGAT